MLRMKEIKVTAKRKKKEIFLSLLLLMRYKISGNQMKELLDFVMICNLKKNRSTKLSSKQIGFHLQWEFSGKCIKALTKRSTFQITEVKSTLWLITGKRNKKKNTVFYWFTSYFEKCFLSNYHFVSLLLSFSST